MSINTISDDSGIYLEEAPSISFEEVTTLSHLFKDFENYIQNPSRFYDSTILQTFPEELTQKAVETTEAAQKNN